MPTNRASHALGATLFACVLSLGATLPAAAEGAFSTPLVHFGESEAIDRLGRAELWTGLFDAPGPDVHAGPLSRFALGASLTQAAQQAADPAGQPRRRPVAITYSDGYLLRAKIHKYASVATLPLFGAQYLLGERLNDGTRSEAVRATHAGIATGMVGLFGVNSVTGLWNLWEARKDPNGRGRRILHSLLMLGADGGFVATGLLAPTNDGGGDRSLHRTVAISSIGVATAGYLLMLLTN